MFLRAVFLATFMHGSIQLFQQFTLAAGQVDWRFQHHAANQVAGRRTTYRFYAFAAQTELFASLGFRRNLEAHLVAIQRWHFQLTPQGSGSKADRHFAIQVVAIALEQSVRLDEYLHIQITRWATIHAAFAFTRQTHPITIVHTRWNAYCQSFLLLLASLTMTIRTWVSNDLALAMTMRAGLLDGEETLLDTYLTTAMTGWAGLRMLMLQVGGALERYTRNPLLRHSLRLMRAPAQAAGLGALQSFLENGFDTFREMRGAREFLDTIANRERELAARLFGGGVADATAPG